MPETNATAVWNALKEGNRRYVDGNPRHGHQDSARRSETSGGQQPDVVVFACGDSREPVEILFDKGIGDVFVVRTAGHVLDDSVTGSIEFATELLNTPLVVVLGHESCGGLGAAIKALDEGELPPGFIRCVVERIAPSVLKGRNEGQTSFDELLGTHVMETANVLVERSELIRKKVEAGECAIVGASYSISDGAVEVRGTIGDVDAT